MQQTERTRCTRRSPDAARRVHCRKCAPATRLQGPCARGCALGSAPPRRADAITPDVVRLASGMRRPASQAGASLCRCVCVRAQWVGRPCRFRLAIVHTGRVGSCVWSSVDRGELMPLVMPTKHKQRVIDWELIEAHQLRGRIGCCSGDTDNI